MRPAPPSCSRRCCHRAIRHPDVLLTFSAACEQLGRFPNAVGAAQAAIEQAPERADLWAHYGRLLHDGGQFGRRRELPRARRRPRRRQRPALVQSRRGGASPPARCRDPSTPCKRRSSFSPRKRPSLGCARAWRSSGPVRRNSRSRAFARRSSWTRACSAPLTTSPSRFASWAGRQTPWRWSSEAMRAGLSAPETKSRPRPFARRPRAGSTKRCSRIGQLIAETPGAIDAQETLASACSRSSGADRRGAGRRMTRP